MKMSHQKFVDAFVTSLEDNRICTYAVAEAIVREPVDLQERFIILFMNYLEQIRPSVLLPESMHDLSSFAEYSWQEYFHLLGISNSVDIAGPGALLTKISENDGGWHGVSIEIEYQPQKFIDESVDWSSESVLKLFRELSSLDLKAKLVADELTINEF
jgi:hypothetical protein